MRLEHEPEDAELVIAARAGDQAAFGELVRRHQRVAFAVAYSLLGDPDEAEDRAQEAFLRALRNLDLLADPAKFGPWLRRVAFGTSVDWLRGFRSELYRGSHGLEPEAEPSSAPSPLDRLEHLELRERVLSAVATLPPRYRVPLSMYHLDGLSHARVAAALGVGESTVRSLVTRARRRLASLLEGYAREVIPLSESPADLLDETRSGPTLLHVLNGDATRLKLEASDVPGRVVVWADVLHEGPVPGDVSRSEWLEVRARTIAGAGWAPLEEARATFAAWEAGLESHAVHREVVLWLEHDLFDQLLLLHHLDWFAERRRPGARLSLICIGEYPGVPGFKGLGQLGPDQLASLLDTRQTVTARQLELGRAGWRAFTGPDPRRLETFLAGDTTALPFLAPALRRLLEEYPSTRGGLPLTERRILQRLMEGSRPAVDVFHALHAAETAFYIADLSFWRVVTELAAGADPLVRIGGAQEGDRSAENPLRGRRIELTDSGRAVLAGAADAVRLRGIDRWIGGVQLRGREAAWRWDPEAGRLRSSEE